MGIERNPTRAVRIGSVTIGGGNPIVVLGMCATKTADVKATAAQIESLVQAGAGVVRVAVDTSTDATALAAIRDATQANLSVDLQENYRLAAQVAPFVNKIRYNPGHLYHHERRRPWQEKVRYLADIAARHDCALRVGVNCGSVDPAVSDKYAPEDIVSAMLDSALEHCHLLDSLGFTRYCISLKHSEPFRVIELNRRFAAQRPDVPLHLGVTEAGVPPAAIIKTRQALEPLLLKGIGDTIRVSLTVPNSRKHEEIDAGRAILADIAAGRLSEALGRGLNRLNIISCPSCSRVENEEFVQLATRIQEMTQYAADFPLTLAVMGCRVNGPGETDHADLGVWCGPSSVNLKRRGTRVGTYRYDEILARVKVELDSLVAEQLQQPCGVAAGAVLEPSRIPE